MYSCVGERTSGVWPTQASAREFAPGMPCGSGPGGLPPPAEAGDSTTWRLVEAGSASLATRPGLVLVPAVASLLALSDLVRPGASTCTAVPSVYRAGRRTVLPGVWGGLEAIPALAGYWRPVRTRKMLQRGACLYYYY